jgi:Protein of unknown function (DUF3987)
VRTSDLEPAIDRAEEARKKKELGKAYKKPRPIADILRGNQQGVVPPSIHVASGETLVWNGGYDPNRIKTLTEDELRKIRGAFGVTALIAHHMPVMGRREYALALGGFLARNGVDEDDAAGWVEIAWRHGVDDTDEDAIESAVKKVRDSYTDLENGEPTTGGTTLNQIVPGMTVAISKALGLRRLDTGESAPEAPAPTVHMPAPEPFPVHVLPKVLRDVIEEASQEIGCPPDYMALPVMASCAAAVGGGLVLKIKRTWKEPCVFWYCIVGDPTTKKSPALKYGTGGITEIDIGLGEAYEKALEKHDEAMRKHRRDLKVMEKEDVPPPEPKAPLRKRALVSDTTVEALVRILRDNPHGVLLSKDELASWVRSFNQYRAGKGDDRQFWLSAWTCTTTPVDRAGGGTIMVKKPVINIVGGVQPKILPELGEKRDDGFLERILFAYPERRQRGWTEFEVSEETEEAYIELIKWMRKVYAPVEGVPHEPTPINFFPAARAYWGELVNRNLAETLEPGFPEPLKAVWGKFEAYIARHALLFAAIRLSGGDSGNSGNNFPAPDIFEGKELVSREDLERAWEVVNYFKCHARRVYSQLFGGEGGTSLIINLKTYLYSIDGVFDGTVSELWHELPEPKPSRPNELGRDLPTICAGDPDLVLVSKSERSDGTHVVIQCPSASESSAGGDGKSVATVATVATPKDASPPNGKVPEYVMERYNRLHNERMAELEAEYGGAEDA